MYSLEQSESLQLALRDKIQYHCAVYLLYTSMIDIAQQEKDEMCHLTWGSEVISLIDSFSPLTSLLLLHDGSNMTSAL